ncbi:aldo/keto reductase family protein [Legionella waltersii]|uniref:Aldo/keto reductase-like diketogulonate reductase n=1 Tax=Legionella waltersii TaxID=66969 RepID=A0A0W1A0G1_9GAMM|nr:aldo/keto reductase [Legionella waltersii]KTD74827.1 aldo/keto reductase-like diketogulonate reductase [Legionella waltersii]SNV11687.1 Aldo/keto reductases like protein [Legionella waltersii]
MPYNKVFPLMGVGTFIGVELDRIEDVEQRMTAVKNTVYKALELGYRHIDLALSYGNLPAIGGAIQQAMKPKAEGGLGISRDELWLTMKSDQYKPDDIQAYLKALGVEYIDTFMLHHPYRDHIFGSEEQLTNTWEAVTSLLGDKVKTVGVSNCYPGHLSRLIAVCDKNKLPKPFSNEVESNLLCPNDATIKFCRDNGIQVIAYSPLGYNMSSIILKSEILVTIADNMDATPTQIALAWHMARGVAVIPKSTHTERLQENLGALTYVDQIDVNKQRELSTIAFDGMDAVTQTAEEAKAHAESLVWVVAEPERDSEVDDEIQGLNAVRNFC